MGEIDRAKAMDELLSNFRRNNPDGLSDTDLVLEWLEKVLIDPKIGGGSAKLEEMEIKPEPTTISSTYSITWRKNARIR